MSDATPTPVNTEYTQPFRVGGPPNGNGNIWKTISLILGLMLTGGTLISVMGKAFYVTRTEYTEKTQRDAVEQSNLSQSVDSIKISLRDQEVAFRELAATVNELKIDVIRNTHLQAKSSP